MRPHHAAHLVSLLLLIASIGCSCSPSFWEAREGDLAIEPVSIITVDEFTFLSPFDERHTKTQAAILMPILRSTSELLECPTQEPVTLRLVPVQRDEPSAGSRNPGKHGMGGYVCSERPDEAVVYIPVGDSTNGSIEVMLAGHIIRHEVVHVLAPRAGLTNGRRWFDEGLASLVAGLNFDDEGRARLDDPAPMSIWNPKNPPTTGSVARLLTWGYPHPDQPYDAASDGPRYALAHGFLRYLLRLEQPGSIAQRTRAMLALDDKALLAAEDGWLEERRAAGGPVAEAVSLLDADDSWVRMFAFVRLTRLVVDDRYAADVHAADVISRALAALDEQETYLQAAMFLSSAAEHGLSSASRDQLVNSDHPAKQLLGQLLRREAGEELDVEATIAAEAVLEDDWMPCTLNVRLKLQDVVPFQPPHWVMQG